MVGHRTGQVRRGIVSFVRRGGRITIAQQRNLDRYSDQWVIEAPAPAADPAAPVEPLDLTAIFGREAPLIVEIGPGMGESLVPMAAARPEASVLAFEVYQPSIGSILGKIADAGIDNLRVMEADAADVLARLLPADSIDRLWTFFPDPWPKKKHHKRRLVDSSFADLVAARMKRHGIWRLATDWEDYAGQMREVLDDHPRFVNEFREGWAPRWEQRPMTRFEQRGITAGRHIFDLSYRRR
ncbi:tRNA (guanosine(46)-N7)-methyltransferase TrmB [Microlunatus speluncae]|uniref:tRNA (guanosine(46)-N7)-methyltransferase TrmB n=1 Tax=Microlunatus speluncae TaxID=2594267 RepID=UPI0012663ED1|nr:tRNA (guanosine(46)-N7)-methyltransferase TrmB [Microlunatus speluncae]